MPRMMGFVLAAGAGALTFWVLGLSTSGVRPHLCAPSPAVSRTRTVRVAAIQCYSPMGKVVKNKENLARLIGRAASQGARIVVLPECAVQGYMNPAEDRRWSLNADGEKGELSVEPAAEPVPGPATDYFAAVARRYRIYLALPLIEAEGKTIYNSLVLLDPQGRLAAHHRKQSLWAMGDAGWAAAGDRPVQVAATPYGRLGLMICHDVHVLPEKLKAARAEIVLYAVGWYGPNTENWFQDIFPRRHVIPNGFAVVAANWCGERGKLEWHGQGYSCVIARDGAVLAISKQPLSEEIICADLPAGTATPIAPDSE